MKKAFISVGEISGDNYASQLVKALPEFRWIGITGPKMREAGVETVEKLENISVVGLMEALPKYLKIKKAFRRSVEILDKGIDLLVVVDFPGFNLKLLKEAKKRGIKTVYFIAPQVWAWGKGRIPKIAQYTDLLIAIWPFEKKIYKDYISESFKVEYVGHPILDIIKTEETEESFKKKLGIEKNKKIFGLLPGSRESEVKTLLPILLSSAEIIYKNREDLHFVIPSTPNMVKIIKNITDKPKIPLTVVTNKDLRFPSYEVMKHSVFLNVASGTATLETAILGNPFILVYKVSPITFFIGKMLVSIEYLGLPNLIAEREIIKELLQKECNPENIARWSLKYLKDPVAYEKVKEDLASIRKALGEKGAIKRTARLIKEIVNF
ncbi:lipid-A-disaccharide synthase [Persephonella sp.]